MIGMSNVLSPFFSDEDLETQLRTFLSDEEMHSVDFKRLFHEVMDNGECLELRFRGKLFLIDKVTGCVQEC